jgi:hypothetical protein
MTVVQVFLVVREPFAEEFILLRVLVGGAPGRIDFRIIAVLWGFAACQDRGAVCGLKMR